MKSSHSAATVFAAFDEPNLIAHAGLVPAVRLAERCDLPRLVAEKVKLTGAKNGAGTAADAKALSIVAGMVAGADSVDDLCGEFVSLRDVWNIVACCLGLAQRHHTQLLSYQPGRLYCAGQRTVVNGRQRNVAQALAKQLCLPSASLCELALVGRGFTVTSEIEVSILHAEVDAYPQARGSLSFLTFPSEEPHPSSLATSAAGPVQPYPAPLGLPILRMTGANPDRTVRIQFRPDLIDGCLAQTGLVIEPT